MAFSAPRLTIYALLSSVEEDLRTLIITHLSAIGGAGELLEPKLLTSAISRYVDDNGDLTEIIDLESLLPYTDLGDLVNVLNRFRSQLPPHVSTQLNRLNPQLTLLLPIRKRIAHVRPFRYDDLARVTTFTDQVSAEYPEQWLSVTETVARLAREPGFVFDLPQPRFEEALDSAYHNLPLPEFDDTGFLGREAEVSTVISLCKGPWPVISLIGEGGLGKTALALRVAYDLLDDSASPFDAIIWSSSKTTRLDPTQIRQIDGAIRNSLGLLQDVALQLGSPTESTDAIQEILEYLATFRVLVILDNLETVMDQVIRDFLARLPAGSKILITSRIGVGEFENRVNIQPLPNVEASRLLRAAAKLSGVVSLATRPEEDLRAMCNRMQNNPLFIKWFVSAVQAGVQPEGILVEPRLFLDFCMSNVYEHLSEAARRAIRILLASPDELSLPEMIYFNSYDTFETQAAVQELLATNMLAMNSTATTQSRLIETRYRLTELARLYLTRHHPLDPEEDRDLERVRLKLNEEQRRIHRQITGDRYESRTIATRSNSDLLVVRPLLDALRFVSGSQFAEALDAVEYAKTLAPDFFECFRVEGQVNAAARNIGIADAAFRTALDLQPDSSALRYFYARFLRELRHDIDGALTQLETALNQSPGDLPLLLEHARCNLDVLAFSAARESLDTILLEHGGAERSSEDVWRLSLDYFVRRANFAIQTGDHIGAVGLIEALRREYETAPIGVAKNLRARLSQALGAVWCCIHESSEDGVKARAEVLLAWMQSVKGMRLPQTVALSDERSVGVIKHINEEQMYGFLTADDGTDAFFPRSALDERSEFDLLKAGMRVSFSMAASERGRRALNVRID